MGIEALSRLFGDKISRRSLQRRLSELVAAGRLISEKKGRSTRYFLSFISSRRKGSRALNSAFTFRNRSTKNVQKPQIERTPTSYNREFLDRYRPNESKYLTPETIARLTRIGHSARCRKAGRYLRASILDRLLVDLSWASSQLEGNTYLLLDTKRLIEHGQEAEGKDAAETQMILNHKAAIEFLVESTEEIEINRQMILNLHALLSTICCQTLAPAVACDASA